MDLFKFYEQKAKIDEVNSIYKNEIDTQAFNNQVQTINAMTSLIIQNIHETQSPPEAYEYITFNDRKCIAWNIANENTTKAWLLHDGTLIFRDSNRHRDYQYAEIVLMKISDMEEYSKQFSEGGNLCKSQMEKDGLDGIRINPEKIINWLIKNADKLKVSSNSDWQKLISVLN